MSSTNESSAHGIRATGGASGHNATSYGVTVAGGLEPFSGVWPTFGDGRSAASHVFQRREWLETWMDSIGTHRAIDPLFVRVDDASGAPLMLLPLGLSRRQGLRILTFLDGDVSDYNAPVLFPAAAALDAAAVTALWRRICAALPPFDAALFTKMPATVERTGNPLRLLPCEADDVSGHMTPLVTDSGVRYAPKSGHQKRDGARKRRRLNEIAPLRFAVAQTPDEQRRVLQAMMRQKGRRYQETYGADLFDDAGFRAYFERLTARFAAAGHVRLAALYCGDEAIASHWGLAAGNRFYYLMPACEAGRWAPHSPGWLLLEDLLAWAMAEGFRWFDLGVGDEPYKSKCDPVPLPLFRASLPRTLAGRAWLTALRARRALAQSRVGDAVRALRTRRIAARLTAGDAARDRAP